MKTELMGMVRLKILRAGSVGKLADTTSIDRAYLSRLARGLKENPSERVLDELGIERVSYYVWKDPKDEPQTEEECWLLLED
jgi:transcriptional regulator with XRE-family HTH domain|tara:strand:+ start:6075 stop:6320 length:246 start_codon:yes stop_codon:yes gene_type:complete